MENIENKFNKYTNLYKNSKNINKYFQTGGRFKNFIDIKNRIEKKPDRVLILTNQFPTHFQSSSLQIGFYDGTTGNLKNLYNTLNDFIEIEFGKSAFIINEEFLKEEINVEIKPETLISNGYVLNIDRPKAEFFLNTNYISDTIQLLFRNSSRPNFIALSIKFNDRISHQLIKIQYKNIFPYLSDFNRNPEYFERYLNIDPTKPEYFAIPGTSSLTIKNNLQDKLGDIPIDIIFNVDNNTFKKSKFDLLTNNSVFIIVGHCCDSTLNITSDVTRVYTTNGIPISNQPIKTENISSYLVGREDLLIILWACKANNYFAFPLINNLKNNMIISRRENITRLGSKTKEESSKIINEFICGIDNESFITLWNNKQNEPINIPTRFLNIESEYFSL